MWSLHREATALAPVHPAAPAQEERRPGPLLQRPDHRAGEEVRDPEVPVTPGEEAAGQDAAAQRETGNHTLVVSLIIQRGHLLHNVC